MNKKTGFVGMSPAAIGALAKGDLDNFLVAATPGGIEAQEARGQQDFVKAETLPTEMGRYSQYDCKDILEAAGVKFLGPVEGDPIFQRVTLPAGWSKKATDHSMWSNLVDDKGRVRARIFYKAAFYDRSATLSLETRFDAGRDYSRADDKIVAQAKDGDTVIFETEPIEGTYDDARKQEQIAAAWLAERYPDYQNPAAYWD